MTNNNLLRIKLTTFFLDLTLLYRKNKENYSSIWAFQIKNATGTPSNYIYQYNYRENKIENTNQVIVAPNKKMKYPSGKRT